MIRFLLVRIIIPLVMILIARSLIAAIVKGFAQAFKAPVPPETRQAGAFQSGGELKKDPVCGTYVSAGAAVITRVNGELIHFCSSECRDKYRAT